MTTLTNKPKKKLHKVRNETLKTARANSKKLERGLGIKEEDWKRVAVRHVIDCDKRKSFGAEPKFTK